MPPVSGVALLSYLSIPPCHQTIAVPLWGGVVLRPGGLALESSCRRVCDLSTGWISHPYPCLMSWPSHPCDDPTSVQT